MRGRHTGPPGAGNGEEKVATREAIFEAALHLFEEKGFDATSVQEIVDAAGVTKGAFYHYFQSKDDLVRLMHDQFIDYELSRARDILARGHSSRRSLALLIEEILVSVEKYKASMAIFFRERRFLSEEAFQEIKRKRDEFEGIVVDIIERGIRDGEFRPVPSPRLLAFGIIGMCAWAYQWFQPGGALSAREVGRMYADVVLAGLEKRDGRQTP
ncbi:MAG: TetR family transcriptional regulator [Clostridia bacterium]|nr:TetR family transcriptional regulator [Clostridia bacterium]